MEVIVKGTTACNVVMIAGAGVFAGTKGKCFVREDVEQKTNSILEKKPVRPGKNKQRARGVGTLRFNQRPTCADESDSNMTVIENFVGFGFVIII